MGCPRNRVQRERRMTMQLEQTIEKLMEAYHVAGMSVALIKDGTLVCAKGYGQRNVEENLPMTADTVMPVGSVTKTFTSLALAMLADEGKLDWDTPVITYIPWLKLHDRILTENVTARDLMCHRTGTPKYDLQAICAAPDDKEEMVKSLEHLQTFAPLRTRFMYSNQMVSLAGYLVDVLSGKTYEDFVRERIFAPLGMTSSDFEVDSLSKYEKTSKGYMFANDMFIEPPYMHLGAFAPSGAIVSTAEDMAKFALFQLGDGTWQGERLVSEAMMQEMHSHQMIGTPYFWDFEETQCAEYGLGWFTDIYRGKKLINHGGNTNGFSAQMTLIPSEQFAIIALSNATSCFAVNALAHYASDEVLGVEDIPDWSARFAEIFSNLMSGAMAGMQARAEAKVPDTAPSKPIEDYAGQYVHPGFGTMEFAMSDQGLAGTWNGLPALLRHYNYDAFDLMLPVAGASVPAEFVLEDGKIKGLSVVMEATPGIQPEFFSRA